MTIADEFKRWREGPAVQKAGIARQQLASKILRAELRALVKRYADTDNLATAPAPNGRCLGDCTQDDLREMAKWITAVRAASVRQEAAIELGFAATSFAI